MHNHDFEFIKRDLSVQKRLSTYIFDKIKYNEIRNKVNKTH